VDSDFDIPPVQVGADIGQALRAARESRNLSLDEVAELTRIRRAYLADLEAMRLDRLPSRPFTIGYIRAYAEALGLDGEAAVERFKADEPDLNEPLRAPVGVGDVGKPRTAAIIGGVVVMLFAIVLWNVAQRAINDWFDVETYLAREDVGDGGSDASAPAAAGGGL